MSAYSSKINFLLGDQFWIEPRTYSRLQKHMFEVFFYRSEQTQMMVTSQPSDCSVYQTIELAFVTNNKNYFLFEP